MANLTDKQEKFVQELLVGKSQREAYRSAYPKSKKWADSAVDTTASQLLKIPKVLQRYNELHGRLIKEAEDDCIVTAKDVLRQLTSIAMTDTNEIVELRRECCRYCYGLNHRYQMTENEMLRRKADHAAALEQAMREGKELGPFDTLGGTGFNPTWPPNPECPECFGEGVSSPFFKDTRNLSPGAKSLFAGVKVTKDGIEVKLHSKDKALELLGRHLELFKDKLEVEIKGGVADRLKRAREKRHGPSE